MSDATEMRAPRVKLLLVMLVFAAPVLLAYVMYYAFPQAAPGGRTNKGELLVPARPLPDVALAGTPRHPLFRRQWTLLVVAPEGCGQQCRARLRATRKVDALLHEDSRRVQRVLVTGDPGDKALSDKRHPNLLVRIGGDELTAFFGRVGPEAVGPGVIYLIDPLGNWVLYYPAGRPATALLADLKHLLKVSQIG